MDWQTWHDDYERPDSSLARRLRAVQDQIRLALDAAPSGPLRVISLCAGQGRDLLEVLADHPRRADVRARLVEVDARIAAYASAAAARLDRVEIEVLVGDAALTDHYRDLAPADLVLVCGVFGNVTSEDVERTVDCCTQLCAAGGTVIWTRHPDPPGRVPQVCEWFESRAFTRVWVSDPTENFGVGVHRFAGEPQPLLPGVRMFDFVGYDVLDRQ